jgi:hypothetical protein
LAYPVADGALVDESLPFGAASAEIAARRQT